jgi:hypothetical protein
LFHGGRSKSSSEDISLVANFVSNQLTFFSQIRISGERIEYDKDDVVAHHQRHHPDPEPQRDALHGGALSALRTDYGIP